jgi:beta-lactamase superfamily II metal-dependent hydrolase
MRASIGWLSILALSVAGPAAQTRPAAPAKGLDIYVVDVEGGNATLFVAPSGASVLIDTGNGGAAAVRDADRIMAAVKAAGLTQIDHLITTHWHGDHFGGMAELASRIQIQHFIDHGGNVQPAAAADEFLQKVYPGLYAKGKHTVVKPGDKVAVAGLDWRIVTSAGETVKTSLPGGGKPNPYCAGFKPQDPDRSENAQSVGSVIAFGKFRVAHLGDITWNKEFDLMCPGNPIGTVDLFVVSHHGQAISNSEALVHALAPRVGIINNGTRKGGQPDAMRILHLSPGLEDLWQLHFSQLSGQEYTVPGMFIANSTDEPLAAIPVAAIQAPAPGPGAPPPPAHNGMAYWVKVSAQTDGTFTVSNARNSFSKTYRAR